MGGVRTCESKNLFPKIASPVASRRFGPSQESDTGALGIASSEIDATAACMYIDATQAMLTEGRVLGAERMATCTSGGAGSWCG